MFFLKEKWLLLPIGLSLLPIVLLIIFAFFRIGSRSVIETTSIIAAFGLSFLVLYILMQFFLDLTGVSWTAFVRGVACSVISFLYVAVSFFVTLGYAPSVGGNSSRSIWFFASPVMISAVVSEKIIQLFSEPTSFDADLNELMRPMSNFSDFQIIDARALVDGGIVLAVAYNQVKTWDLRFIRFLEVHENLEPKTLMTLQTTRRPIEIEAAPWSVFDQRFPSLKFAHPRNRDFIGVRGVTIPELEELKINDLLEGTSKAIFVGCWKSITVMLHQGNTGQNEDYDQWTLLGVADQKIQFRLKIGSSITAPGTATSPDHKWLYVFHESLTIPIRLDPFSGRVDEQFARTFHQFLAERSEQIDIGTALFYSDYCAIFIGHLKEQYDNRAYRFCEKDGQLVFKSAEFNSSDLPFQSGNSQLTSVTPIVNKTLFLITDRSGLNPKQVILNKEGELDLDFAKSFSNMIGDFPGKDGIGRFLLRDTSIDSERLYFISTRHIWVMNPQGIALGSPREIIKVE